MREIKFKYIFKGLPFSSADAGFNWHVKIFTLDRIEAGVICLSNLYHLGELVAKLQFTGLTDANLVEIYESDIAQCDRGLLWVIKFINGCFMACNPVDENDYCMIDDYPLAVVGSEHQNPELLEQLK